MANDFDFDLDFDLFDEKKKEKIEPRRYIRVRKDSNRDRHSYRRFTSEQALLESADWHFERGYIYHCISFGDVDSLTFVKHILRQQRLDYLLISTWCIGVEDVADVESWLKRGFVSRFDCYLGEIAKASYAQAQLDLEKAAESTGGRCGIFRNHSKIMVGYGDRFDFVICSSANVNTNPRTEQTVVFCDTETADFYKSFFDDIQPFNGTPPTWEPWRRGDI